MLDKLSITIRGGVEVYSYSSPLYEKKELKDTQLLSGLFYAIQSVSEEIKDPVSSIRLENSIIYVKTYSDFSIFLTFSQPMNEKIIEESFRELAKLTLIFFDQLKKFDHPSEFVDQLRKLILQLNENENFNSNFMKIDNRLIKKKVAIIGLGKAGKTSILKKFFDKWENEKIKNITPTIGVQTSKNMISFLNESLLALDFGGQKNYQNNYLVNKNNWTNLSSLIYVIDIQEPDLFSESKKYLDKIYKVVSDSKIKLPFFTIFVHKFDVDKKTNLETNIMKFFEIFKEYTGKTVVYFTSIYDDTCVQAVMKTLFLSLPTIIIKQILDRILMDKLEKEILNETNYNRIANLNEKELTKLGLSTGNIISEEFQALWLASLSGNINPTPRGILAKQINFNVTKQGIKIEIENWQSKGISNEITNPLLTGILRGIMQSLFLTNELKMMEEKHKTSWLIEFT